MHVSSFTFRRCGIPSTYSPISGATRLRLWTLTASENTRCKINCSSVSDRSWRRSSPMNKFSHGYLGSCNVVVVEVRDRPSVLGTARRVWSVKESSEQYRHRSHQKTVHHESRSKF